METQTIAVIVVLIFAAGIGYLALYTDQLGPISQFLQSSIDIEGILPLSIANTVMRGDLVCDLDVRIPTLVNNKALFGTPMVDIITDEEGNKLSGERISGFLDDNEYLYISTESMASITYEWKNCFNEGTGSINSLIPLFNGQIASERIAALTLQDPNVRTPDVIEPLVASGIQTKTVTRGTVVTLSILGTSLDNGLRLVDKNEIGIWTRNMVYDDGIAYPVSATLRYTIENVRVDDYEISANSQSKPINEMRMTEDYIFRICGIVQNPDKSLNVKSMC